MKTKFEEIVEDYCCDAVRIGCDSDYEKHKELLRSDLEELIKETREKVIEEFVNKYKEWCKNPCNCNSRGADDICQGICIDCFIKTGLLEEK